MVDTLKNYFNQTTNIQEAEYYLILDLGLHVNNQINEIANYRKQGIKTILLVFDPAAFNRVYNLIDGNALDKIILFDAQFKNKFKTSVFVSDYFLNKDLFEENNNKHENKVCVYGTLGCVGRNNEYNLDIVDKTLDSYEDFYKIVQKYNGVCVYDTGFNENFSGLEHYNHVKAVEALMCGVNPYCQPGIKTKRYDKYLKKYEQIPNPVPIDFDQKEIWDLNEITIKELVHECII